MIIAGTGHRPDKIAGYDNPAADQLMLDLLVKWIEVREPKKIISGGALGFDQALATAAMLCKVPYVIAVPCRNHECKWSKEDQAHYMDLLSEAADIVVVSDKPYFKECMQIRNEWMIDHCDRVLSLFNGSKGGTYNCLQYAKKQGKGIFNLWMMWTEANAKALAGELFPTDNQNLADKLIKSGEVKRVLNPEPELTLDGEEELKL